MKKMFILAPLIGLLPSCGNQLVVDSTGRVTSVPASLMDPCMIQGDEMLRAAEADLAQMETNRQIGVSRSEALIAFVQPVMDACEELCGGGCRDCPEFVTMGNQCARALVTEVYGP